MDYIDEFKPYYEAQILPIVKKLKKKRTKRFYIATGISIFFLLVATFIIIILKNSFSPEKFVSLVSGLIISPFILAAIIYSILENSDKSHEQFKLEVIKNCGYNGMLYSNDF